MVTDQAWEIEERCQARRPGRPGPCRPQGSAADHLIARSAAMREVLDLVRKVARTDTPVLIQGELGVGKTAVAREIHRLSRRAAGPLVHVACGVLREAELNEKLFGERAGSFSAETPSLSSLLQSSSQGTLFLEEVSELPLWAQVKLLDCLQPSTSLSREGGSSNSAGVRVIAATTCDPATAMAGNTCYPGLYYYLNVVQIRIPPLRYRQEDIRALGEHFLAAANSRQGSPSHAVPQRLSQEAWQTLLGYDWPGNVLQLASVIARAVTLADGPEIGQEQMAACLGEVQPHSPAELISVPLAGGLKEMEHAIIHEVLRRCRGNKAAAARSLRLHRRTLYRLLGK